MMNEQDLEEKIKEKIDTILGNLVDLNDRYKENMTSNKPLFIALCIIFRQIGIVLRKANICFNAKDFGRQNILKFCSMPIPAIPFVMLPFFQPPKDMTPISLQDAYDFMEMVEKSFETEDKISLLADQIEKSD